LWGIVETISASSKEADFLSEAQALDGIPPTVAQSSEEVADEFGVCKDKLETSSDVMSYDLVELPLQFGSSRNFSGQSGANGPTKSKEKAKAKDKKATKKRSRDWHNGYSRNSLPIPDYRGRPVEENVYMAYNEGDGLYYPARILGCAPASTVSSSLDSNSATLPSDMVRVQYLGRCQFTYTVCVIYSLGVFCANVWMFVTPAFKR
jgi:hypothetical protein